MAFRSRSIVFIGIGGAGSVWGVGHRLAADGCDDRKAESMMSSHVFQPEILKARPWAAWKLPSLARCL
jgi:hypothetical protein